jgi:hypothetical protein
MTLHELKSKIDAILEQNPDASWSTVLVDTEARKFPAHMIGMKNVYYDPSNSESMGYDITMITIDLTGATY